MITAVRQTVTVKTDGHLEIDAPELRAGSVTEVIVLVPDGSDAAAKTGPTPAERLAALHRLQQSLNLSDADVAKWQQEVRLERQAWRLPGDVEA